MAYNHAGALSRHVAVGDRAKEQGIASVGTCLDQASARVKRRFFEPPKHPDHDANVSGLHRTRQRDSQPSRIFNATESFRVALNGHGERTNSARSHCAL